MMVNTSSLRGIFRASPTRCRGAASHDLRLPSRSRASSRKTPCARVVAETNTPRDQHQTALPHAKGRAGKATTLTIPKATTARAF